MSTSHYTMAVIMYMRVSEEGGKGKEGREGVKERRGVGRRGGEGEESEKKKVKEEGVAAHYILW